MLENWGKVKEGNSKITSLSRRLGGGFRSLGGWRSGRIGRITRNYCWKEEEN